MLAVLILATIVASVVAGPPKQKVHFQPVPKAVTHEEPALVGKNVPLLKQHPRYHKQIVTVVDQVANIIKRPKLLVKEIAVREKYPVEKPVIHHRRVIKPIHKTRTIVHRKRVKVPRPIIRTKIIAVPQPHIVHKPYHRVKTVTQVFERVHKIPKPIPRPELRIISRDRPFPVENLVIRKRPRVVEHPFDKPIPIVEEITNVIRKPVPHPKNKVLTVDKPVIHHKKVPYFPKAHGGHQAGGYGQANYGIVNQGYGQQNYGGQGYIEPNYGFANQGVAYNGGQIYDAGFNQGMYLNQGLNYGYNQQQGYGQPLY
ncbi:mantle protein-like isoform X2 [Mytilus californianus]|uniref:mantle protein-like isoform X2 n=1 Tax=Mytilus californianus TaxID=6549 RepID=UPI002246480D|nr:mantle protein-like isoform X2 [Mytilus californianus]